MKTKIVLLLTLFVAVMSPVFPQASKKTTLPGRKYNDDQKVTFFSSKKLVSIRSEGPAADAANQTAKKRFEQLDKIFNPDNSESEIYRINNANGEPVRVSTEMANMIKFAVEMHDITEGAYNPLMYSLNKAWNIDGSKGSFATIPDDSQIKKLIPLTDVSKIRFNGTTVTLQKGAQLDFGDAALFYAADEAVKILMAFRCTGGIVDVNGNQVVFGKNVQNSGRWNFYINSPFRVQPEVRSVKFSEGCGHTTKRIWLINESGTKINPVLNPKTGKPSESKVASATVIASNGRYAAALSHAIYVLGYEKTLLLQKARNDFEFVIIEGETEESAFYTSPSLTVERAAGAAKAGEHPAWEKPGYQGSFSEE